MITAVLAAGAGDDHAVAMDFSTVTLGLQRQGHFSPWCKGGSTAELDAVLMDDD